MEDHQYNSVMKIQYIQFVVFCHTDDIKTPYGIERHDLLGYLIRDIFNWSNMFGMQAKLVYDREGVTDTAYSTRTLKFELTRTNSLNKAITRNKKQNRRRSSRREAARSNKFPAIKPCPPAML